MRGIVFPARQAALAPYTSADYERCRKFADTICYTIWWSRDMEPDITRPGYYTMMSQLRTQVNLAKAAGYNVILSVQDSFHQTGDYGWADALGNDYIVLDAGGRQRYANFIDALARNFTDCMIDFLFFPYHGEGEKITLEVEKYFYDAWQPMMINVIRAAGNNQPIICTLMFQGVYPFAPSLWEQRVQTGGFLSPNFKKMLDPNVLYAVNGHDGYNETQVFILGAKWNYDRGALKAQWQPAIQSGLPVICLEFTNFMHHVGALGVRPIEQSRLDLLTETLDLLCANNISYTYFRYENPITNSAPFEVDFSSNAVTESLKAHYTLIPPIDVSTAGGVSLIILDAALVAYYIYTRLVG